jgi:hypothetical protein
MRLCAMESCAASRRKCGSVWRSEGDGVGARQVSLEQKITLGEMRAMGVRGLLVYCADYKCAHLARITGDRWPDHMRVSDLEESFVCQACGARGADIRPDFDWDKKPSSS